MSKLEQLDQEIISKYNSGASSTTLAKEYNVSKSTIIKLLKANNISMRTTYKLSKSNVRDICESYSKGKSLTNLANSYNVSIVAIHKVIRKNKCFRKLSNNQQNNALYSTTYVPEYNGFPLTKQNLLNMSSDEKETVVEYLFNFYRSGGFPYPQYNKDILMKDWNRLVKANSSEILDGNILNISSPSGIKVFKHFCPHYNSVSSGKEMSMIEAFNDDEILKRVIGNRIGYSYKETFTMCGNMLRQGLRNSKLSFAASIFKPILAKFLYERYVPVNGVIYDYSMGFGQRFLGAASSKNNYTYIACDPWKEAIDGVNAMASFLGKAANINNVGAESFCPKELIGTVDFAFSSPPYFDKEVYSSDKSQAYSGGYDDFINVWWRGVVENSYKLLKVGGRFGLNMMRKHRGNDILEDMEGILSNVGFKKVEEFGIKLASSNSFRGGKEGMKLEPITIWQK
jgi:Mor family transcriptional regulator/tRNA1(Val) A37 N6-methylase TrmN6